MLFDIAHSAFTARRSTSGMMSAFATISYMTTTGTTSMTTWMQGADEVS